MHSLTPIIAPLNLSVSTVRDNGEPDYFDMMVETTKAQRDAVLSDALKEQAARHMPDGRLSQIRGDGRALRRALERVFSLNSRNSDFQSVDTMVGRTLKL